jgi:hypothetical protein
MRGVEFALTAHLRPETARSYDSATAGYVGFCSTRGLEPWPVDEMTFAA